MRRVFAFAAVTVLLFILVQGDPAVIWLLGGAWEFLRGVGWLLDQVGRVQILHSWFLRLRAFMVRSRYRGRHRRG